MGAVAAALLVVPLLGFLALPTSVDDRDDARPADGRGEPPKADGTVSTTPPVELPFDAEPGSSYAYARTYSPADVTAQVGDVVVFDNRDDVAHTFTDDEGRFDSGPLEPGGRYGFAYSSPGTYTFHCELHPTMRGSVRIVPLSSS